MRKCPTPGCALFSGHASGLCWRCREQREAQFAAEDALGDALARSHGPGRSSTACDDQWREDRVDAIGQNGNEGLHYSKQPRYQDAKGEDWIDEFARTASADEFRGAMRFTLGKYVRRAGKKDAIESELLKIEDYARRWREYELALGDEEGDQ